MCLDPDVAAAIDREVEELPPLTDEQLDRLVDVLVEIRSHRPPSS